MPDYLVRDIMRSPAITVSQQADLDEAAELMETYGFRRLPVVDDEGQLAGILTKGDVRAASMAAAVDPYDPQAGNWLTVEEAMTQSVLTVTPETPVVAVVELLLMHKVGGFPVLAPDNSVVGIVTESDIFKLIVREWKENTAPAAPGEKENIVPAAPGEKENTVPATSGKKD